MADSVGGRPDLHAILDEIRATAERRRAAGEYPPDLDTELDRHLARASSVRGPRRRARLDEELARVAAAGVVGRDRIRRDSRVPGGAAIHGGIGRVVARQTDGVLEQVHELADAVYAALCAIVAALPPEDVAALSARVDLTLDGLVALDMAAHQGRLEALEHRVKLLEERLVAPPSKA